MSAARPSPNEMIHFNKWSRKSYSLFRVLGKLVKISVLVITYFLANLTAPGQNTTQKEVNHSEADVSLEEVEIKGQRVSTSLSETARMVRLITREEIARYPANSITEILEKEISTDIRQRGAAGAQSDITIQGSTFEQVLILINGIPFNDPQTGHFNGDIPIPLHLIQRIEIFTGGASRWLGPQAFSGAINIVTTRGNNENAFVRVTGGMNKLAGAEASLMVYNSWKHLISGSFLTHNGYTENTDLSGYKIFYSGFRDKKNVSIKTQAGIGQKKFGAQAFYTPIYPEQYEETGSAFGSAGYERTGKISIQQEVYFKLHQDEFHLFRNEAPQWYTGPNHHLSFTGGMINNIWWINKLGTIVGGVDYRKESILSTILGKELPEAVSLPGTDIPYSNHAQRDFLSLYVEQSLESEKLKIVMGLMTNLLLDNDIHIRFFPGMDLRLRLNHTDQLYLTVNRSLRYPSFTELYYKSPTNLGNPSLLPEEAWSAQSGYQSTGSVHKVRVSSFLTYSENMIDWAKYPDDQIWVTKNINRVLRSGFEMQASWHPLKYDQHWKELNFDLGYRYVHQIHTSGNFDSRYALDHLRHKIQFNTSFPLPTFEKWLISVNLSVQDRAGWYTAFNEKNEPYSHPYTPFVLIDIKLVYRHSKFRVYLDIQNVFNTEYADIGTLVQPGRWMQFGVEFNWQR